MVPMLNLIFGSSMKKYLILTLYIFIAVSVSAQQAQINSITSKLAAYSEKHLVEKLYLHTDRETYLAGETLWYKIYHVDGFEHLPLDLSRVVYVELLNQENEPVLQLKTSMQKGIGNGSIFVPVTINSGNYLLRAYTSWMQNESPGFFFQKPVSIINTFKTLGPVVTNGEEPVDLEIFPEGGYLVQDLPCNLVVKIDKNQVPLQGQLIKNGRDTLRIFDFDSHGLAKFTMVPDSGVHYQVRVISDKGKVLSNKKLVVEKEGYTLQLKDEPGRASLSIHTNLKVPTVNFVIHKRQKVTRAEVVDLQNGAATVILDKEDLGDYISHLTIFDIAGNPVAERLIYKPGSKQLAVSLSGNKGSYRQREKVTLQLQTFDESGKTLPANLSMSVRQVFNFENDDFINIDQYFGLTSDLPSIDFDVSELNPETIDLILLTTGWRRFSWENIFREVVDTLQFQPELNGHIIKGKIVKRLDQTTAPYIKGYLSVPGKKAQVFGGLSNSRGEIYFETRDFYQKNQIIVQTENDSVYQITIENPFSENYVEKQPVELDIDESDEDELNLRSINLQVQNTYYGDKYRQLILPDLDSTAFFGKPDATYYLDDYTRFPTMEDVMREYVANVWVRKNRKGYYYLVYDMAKKDVFKNNSLVLLDGVPIFDTDKIIAYDPLNVQRIDLVKRKFMHGLLTCEGIVSYTTYEGNLKDFPLDPYTLIIDYEGLHARREFYAPEYGQQNHTSMPDFRSLLHWEPEIISRQDGTTEISFYTSDQPGTYLIDVQGMSSNGRFGSRQMAIEVEKNQIN